MQVTLLSVMSDDLAVVNAARVSHARHTKTLGNQDISLIHALARRGH